MWAIEQKTPQHTWEMPYDIVDHEQGAMINAWTYEDAVALRGERIERDYPKEKA